MRRRQFITLIGGAAVAPSMLWPLAARARQGERMRRIGVLLNLSAEEPETAARITAFAQGLAELGWTVGRNLRIDYRWGADQAEGYHGSAKELLALGADVVLASSSPAVAALQAETRTAPIVFVQVTDPVGAGYVASMARPGGNITGFTNFDYGISAKWLELLKEIAPRVTRAAVLRDPTVVVGIGQLGAMQSVAPSLGVELRPVDTRDAGEIERAITEFAKGSNGGLILPSGAFAARHRGLIIALAGPPPAAGGLCLPLLRRRRRLDLLRDRHHRPVPARSGLRRPHPQGREAGRPSGAGADQVRAGAQSQDRQDAQPRRAGDRAHARRRGDRMNRREFITLAGSAATAASAAWPLAAQAQRSERLRRIGMLMPYEEADPEARARVAAIQGALKELGWSEGRNVEYHFRWAANDARRLRASAAELVGLGPDVILAPSTIATTALRDATSTVPIVFVNVLDPVGSRFVASLARPGGNITGFATVEPSIGGKWLELLTAIAPATKRVAILFSTNSFSMAPAGPLSNPFDGVAPVFPAHALLWAPVE